MISTKNRRGLRNCERGDKGFRQKEANQKGQGLDSIDRFKNWLNTNDKQTQKRRLLRQNSTNGIGQALFQEQFKRKEVKQRQCFSMEIWNFAFLEKQFIVEQYDFKKIIILKNVDANCIINPLLISKEFNYWKRFLIQKDFYMTSYYQQLQNKKIVMEVDNNQILVCKNGETFEAVNDQLFDLIFQFNEEQEGDKEIKPMEDAYAGFSEVKQSNEMNGGLQNNEKGYFFDPSGNITAVLPEREQIVKEEIIIKKETEAQVPFLAQIQIKHQVKIETQVSSQMNETFSTSVNNTLQNENATSNDDSKTYKNFLVLFSGWVMLHFKWLLKSKRISKQIYVQFLKIIGAKSQTHNNDGKVYINLSKLSTLFNNQMTRPKMTQFLDIYFLRILVKSTVENKQNYLQILSVLRQGLEVGKITRLR